MSDDPVLAALDAMLARSAPLEDHQKLDKPQAESGFQANPEAQTAKNPRSRLPIPGGERPQNQLKSLISNKYAEPVIPETRNTMERLYARESGAEFRNDARIQLHKQTHISLPIDFLASGVSGSSPGSAINDLSISVRRESISVRRESISVRRETAWHLAHGPRVDPAICAGCREFIRPDDPAMTLADGCRVHLGPVGGDYRCLRLWGATWRGAARRQQRYPGE